MKNLYKISIAALVCASMAFSGFAQENRNTFFLDNNLYSYRVNPAISSEKPFVGFVINNIGTETKSNLGISSFLFPRNGKLVTGLNSAVSSSEFLGKLQQFNCFSEILDESLLALGFNCGEGRAFSTVELNLRTSVSSGIPKSLFEFLKVGSRNEPYDLSGLKLNANSYLEFAYGYSRDIEVVPTLRVGGRVKILLGAVNATASMQNAYLTANREKIAFKGEAHLDISAPEVSFNLDQDGYIDLSSPAFQSNFGLGGFGAAIDLGATYEPIPGLTISASVIDLGGLSWKRNVCAESKGGTEFTGLNEIGLGNNSNVKEEINVKLDELKGVINLKSISDAGSAFEMIPCTINAGARYRMPFYDRLSAGVLAGYKTNSYIGWFDIKGGVTVTPIDWFSLCGTLGYNSYCPTWGAAMSLNFANLNFFASVESYMGALAKLKLDKIALTTPVNPFRSQFNFGFNITFGQRKTVFAAAPHKKAKKEK